jgi:CheY-like chemotaxis protein
MEDVRVLVGAEDARVRRMLAELAREELGVRVVGEASNQVNAVALAKQLRPDIAMLDFSLPHIVGLDTVRLSRISGLDAALAIAAETPGTRVILLSNLDAATSQKRGLIWDAVPRLSIDKGDARMRLTLRELCLGAPPSSTGPVFAYAEIQERAATARGRRLMDRVAGINWGKVFGGMLLGLLGTWMLLGLASLVLLVLLIIAIL